MRRMEARYRRLVADARGKEPWEEDAVLPSLVPPEDESIALVEAPAAEEGTTTAPLPRLWEVVGDGDETTAVDPTLATLVHHPPVEPDPSTSRLSAVVPCSKQAPLYRFPLPSHAVERAALPHIDAWVGEDREPSDVVGWSAPLGTAPAPTRRQRFARWLGALYLFITFAAEAASAWLRERAASEWARARHRAAE